MKHHKRFHIRLHKEEDGSTTLFFRIVTCILILVTICVIYIGRQKYNESIKKYKTSDVAFINMA